ncbi:hypothetical protein Pmani_029522 [Petrolisthes manimaculis]|uniref:Peptidase S1 domain-containing protein n=1 Tax=Petrolisthes manimaculis TaxID=1843537 RepID=A0AAE1NZ66_9EUCA|nr:hypothetical protein Pmani_029522 [Petrolisthes manimaculis]
MVRNVVVVVAAFVFAPVVAQVQGVLNNAAGVWQGECDVHNLCVLGSQCRGGVINTSGAGLLDVRFGPTGTPCTIQDPIHQGAPGVCCRLPDPLPHLSCPVAHQCVPDHTCPGHIPTAPDGSQVGCYLNTLTGDVGVCCGTGGGGGGGGGVSQPPVGCPATQVCVTREQCTAQGSVNTDGAGIFDPRLILSCQLQQGSHVIEGVCCNPPALPQPVYQCPGTGTHSCLPRQSCRGGIITDTYNNEQTCYIGTEPSGVCCEGPVTSCAADSSFFCAPSGTCQGGKVTDPYGGHLPCYVGGTNAVGECCETPIPVDTCATPGSNTVCVDKQSCFGTIAVNAYNYEQDCYVTNTIVGKCCQPIQPVVTPIDICPGQSVCLPEILCLGEILDTTNAYHPYTNTAFEWTRCRSSGTGLVSPGVCCRNPSAPPPNLPPPAGQCGVRNYGLDERIQNINPNNYEAQFGEFPWQAIVFFTNFTFKCGASLVSDEWLLTAAHCVDGFAPHDLRVRLGEWKVDSYDEPGQYEDVLIHSIIVHELYNHAAKNLFNDIALLKLTAPVNFQYHINTVCVPNPDQVFYGATRCYATGWGKDAFDGGRYQVTMKKVDLPLVPRDQCQHDLRNTRLGRFFKLHESFLCAGGEAGKDACEGDGGGPLVCQDPATGNYVVTGITAWGIGCGQQNIPGVYVDVQYFRGWMDSQIFGAGGPQQQGAGGISYGKK